MRLKSLKSFCYVDMFSAYLIQSHIHEVCLEGNVSVFVSLLLDKVSK